MQHSTMNEMLLAVNQSLCIEWIVWKRGDANSKAVVLVNYEVYSLYLEGVDSRQAGSRQRT